MAVPQLVRSVVRIFRFLSQPQVPDSIQGTSLRSLRLGPNHVEAGALHPDTPPVI